MNTVFIMGIGSPLTDSQRTMSERRITTTGAVSLMTVDGLKQRFAGLAEVTALELASMGIPNADPRATITTESSDTSLTGTSHC